MSDLPLEFLYDIEKLELHKDVNGFWIIVARMIHHKRFRVSGSDEKTFCDYVVFDGTGYEHEEAVRRTQQYNVILDFICKSREASLVWNNTYGNSAINYDGWAEDE